MDGEDAKPSRLGKILKANPTKKVLLKWPKTVAEGDMSQTVKRLKDLPSSTFQSLAQVNSNVDDFRDWLIAFSRVTSADLTPLEDMQSSNFLTLGPESDEVVLYYRKSPLRD